MRSCPKCTWPLRAVLPMHMLRTETGQHGTAAMCTSGMALRHRRCRDAPHVPRGVRRTAGTTPSCSGSNRQAGMHTGQLREGARELLGAAGLPASMGQHTGARHVKRESRGTLARHAGSETCRTHGHACMWSGLSGVSQGGSLQSDVTEGGGGRGGGRTPTSGEIAYLPMAAMKMARVTTARTPDTPAISSATQKHRNADAIVAVTSTTVSLHGDAAGTGPSRVAGRLRVAVGAGDGIRLVCIAPCMSQMPMSCRSTCGRRPEAQSPSPVPSR